MRTTVIFALSIMLGIALGFATSGVLPFYFALPALVLLVILVAYTLYQQWRSQQ